MRDLVIHSPSGLRLDFAEENFGGNEHAAVIQAWQDRGHRVKFPGEFICHRHRDRERPWLYLQQRGQLLIAAHWAGTALAGSHEISHGVSDEHKRQVEYVQRAGETAGFTVRTEVRLPTKVIPDAVIYGPQQVGIEVQRSQLTAQAAKARTTKARRAGVHSLWFSDNHSRDPKWLWEVPGVRMMGLRWETTPPPGYVKIVSGVRSLVPRRCRSMRNSSCPDRRYGCNLWHPDHEPLVVLVDDLAEAVPDGRVVPILWHPFAGPGRIMLVRAPDKERYETMTGRAADLPMREQKQRPQGGTVRVECVADAGVLVQAEREPTWIAPDNSGRVWAPPSQGRIAHGPLVIASSWQCDQCGYVTSIDLTGFRHADCGGSFRSEEVP